MSDRNKDGAGKGDKSRVSDHKRYREGIERVFGRKSVQKGYNEPKQGQKSN